MMRFDRTAGYCRTEARHAKITELEPCETIVRRYRVLPRTTDRRPEYTVPPGPGTLRIADFLSCDEEQGAPESKLSFEVEFALESA